MTARMTPRRAARSRNTRETDIHLELALDGRGHSSIETGLGFFDHMLEALAKHAAIDLKIKATGDLHVDAHHMMEDVGIVLGEAIREALAEGAPIQRFGHAYVPMDEALGRVSVDICNRPYLVWNVTLVRPSVGGIDTQLFKEFFHALAMNSGIALHADCIRGENTHHIIEAIYKAFARALRMAIQPDTRMDGPASTKGVL
jgi:imidazoleglycerol-phosphate dehydratase